MTDQDLEIKLEEIRVLAEKAAHAAEATRKYMLWTAIISVAVIVLPLIGLLFVIPSFLSSTVGAYSSLLAP